MSHAAVLLMLIIVAMLPNVSRVSATLLLQQQQ
jgi:hypothetical protein